MKKIVAILAAMLLLCGLSVTAFADEEEKPLTIYTDEVPCEYEFYGDGLVEFNYELPGPKSPLWVEFFVFEADEVPENVCQGMDDKSLQDYRLLKTEADDQFLASSRWVGGSYDDGADCVYRFKTGVTYHIYFAGCDGSVWWYYSTPLIMEYTDTEAPAQDDPADDPTETITVTQTPTQTVTQQATQGATQPPKNSEGFPVWAYIVIGVVVVAAVVSVIIIVAKKKKPGSDQ